jgi:uncharacterized membrane protein YqaE (UPF0057 family)
MKNINYLIALVCVLGLASCASVKDGDFAQRKYLKRTPHIKTDRDFNDINSAVSYASVESKATGIVQDMPLVEVNTSSLSKKEISSGAIERKSSDRDEKKKVKDSMKAASHEALALPAPIVEKPKVHFRKHEQSKPTKVKSEVNQIVLIILAIFIPPLAVFLVDGISTPFWINLILTLLVVTIIFAIIHAFIRIFK